MCDTALSQNGKMSAVVRSFAGSRSPLVAGLQDAHCHVGLALKHATEHTLHHITSVTVATRRIL
jgi:hypothetical protein